MHYKNGRVAKECDPVIHRDGSRIIAGTIHSLNASAQSCTVPVAVPVVGGTVQQWVTVGHCYHAEDAFGAMEEKQPPEKVA